MILILTLLISGYCVGISLFDVKYGRGMSPIVYDNYFYTEAFQNQYSQLVRDVVNINLVYKDEENIKAGNALDKKLVLQRFAEERGMDPYLMFQAAGYDPEDVMEESNYSNYYQNEHSYTANSIYQDDVDPTTELVIESPEKEREIKLKEYTEIYKNDYPIYERRVIQGQLNDFRASKAELAKYTNFLYYLYTDKNGGNIISNSSQDAIQSQEVYTNIEGPYVDGYNVNSNNYYIYYDEKGMVSESYYYDNYQKSIQNILQDNGYFLTAGVSQPLVPGDNFYTQYQNFQDNKDIVPETLTALLILFLLIVLLTIYLILVAGQDRKGGEVVLASIDKIFNDVQTLFVFFAGILSLLLAGVMIETLYYTNENVNTWTPAIKISLGSLLVIDAIIAISYVMSMSRQFKAKQILKNTLFAAIIRKLGSLFSSKTFNGWLLFCMFFYAAINIVLFVFLMAASWDFIPFLFMLLCFGLFNIICAGLLLRALSSLAKIMVAVKETSKGNLNYALDINQISPSFTNFAIDVAGMQIGLKKAVEEAVKGERMKTDLITNVSHDLKTPLTSIITYVDLLQKEEVGNTVAEGYINILVDKSYRLKQLIEDLIEASKASSGNLTVSAEKLDLRQLVMQASGEFEEKIKAARLNFRINSTGETYIRADGKHMWRIAENLISNAIKYSMPNSRVYIDILKTKTTGILIIKNISEQPIEVIPDQLTERFVRGDVSRTTEGSGLGLSIAKSLTALQGGTMEINIDGDLFKVSIKMPLWEEETHSSITPAQIPSNGKTTSSDTPQKEKKNLLQKLKKGNKIL